MMPRLTSPLQRLPLSLAAVLALLGTCTMTSHAEDFQGSTHKLEYDNAPILYSTTPAQDPVALLQKTLEADPAKARPSHHAKFGYLPAVMQMLGVPASSQMWVFSKTSLQRNEIYPDNPRALYFSDSVYIGFVPGAPLLEVAAVDPQLGAVFYTVSQDRDEPLHFQRDENCLNCHGAARSMGVPGFVLRSLSTDSRGEPISGTETELVNHFTPIEDRWGGWYVTGTPNDWIHRGNRPDSSTESDTHAIKKHVSLKRYPGQGSDVVCLLVHDHQTHMHNYITRLQFEGRQNLEMYQHVRYLKHQIQAFLRYLLFTEEAPFPSPLVATPDFAADFSKTARRDHKGRSLRDLDLQTRLFKYPCSFLIETDGFWKMPDPVREAILQKLWEILTGQNQEPAFSKISPDDRRAVLEILRDTLPQLPDYWKRDAPPQEAVSTQTPPAKP